MSNSDAHLRLKGLNRHDIEKRCAVCDCDLQTTGDTGEALKFFRVFSFILSLFQHPLFALCPAGACTGKGLLAAANKLLV